MQVEAIRKASNNRTLLRNEFRAPARPGVARLEMGVPEKIGWLVIFMRDA